MFARFLGALLLLGLAAATPIPEWAVLGSCDCDANLEIQGTAVTGSGLSGQQDLSQVSSNWGDIDAKIYWDATSDGWGTTDGQCQKSGTQCAELEEVLCGFLVNVHIDITAEGSLPSSSDYKWVIEMPGTDPENTINTSTWTSGEKTINKSLPCNDPQGGPSQWNTYPIKVWKDHGEPGQELLFSGEVKAQCVDCSP